jgi:hypothetical protein
MTPETRAKLRAMIAELDAAERENRPAKWLDETQSGFDFSVFGNPEERVAQQRHYRAHFANRLSIEE